jgi:hypothetical protein
MRSVRKKPGFRSNRIARAQQNQENILPQPAHDQDQSQWNIKTHEGLHEMPQGNGKDVGISLFWNQEMAKPRSEKIGAFFISCDPE